MECFFNNLQYVLTNNSIRSFIDDGNGHKVFEGILMDVWVNLVCSVYLSKHTSIYCGQTLQRFRQFLNSPLNERLLGWVVFFFCHTWSYYQLLRIGVILCEQFVFTKRLLKRILRHTSCHLWQL